MMYQTLEEHIFQTLHTTITQSKRQISHKDIACICILKFVLVLVKTQRSNSKVFQSLNKDTP